MGTSRWIRYARTPMLAGLLALVGAACGGGGGGGGAAPPPDSLYTLGESGLGESSFYLLDGLDGRFDATRAPSSFSTVQHLPPVGDQGQQGSCVGWATAYYTKTAQEHLERGWAITSANTNHIFSPAFIYNQRTNSGEGMNVENGCSILVAQGCATLATQPYNPGVDRGVYASATTEAAGYKALSYRRIGAFGSLPDTALDEVRSFMATRGSPVIFGVEVYDSFMEYRGGNVLGNVTSGQSRGGHAIAVVGYDDAIAGGAFRVVNSWGPNWGDRGFAWIPYESMREIFIYAYAVTDQTSTTPPPPPPAPTDSGNNTIAGAGVIATGESKNAAVGNLQDDPADWWKFTVSAGARADISLAGMTSDVDIKLATGQDVRLASSTASGTQAESMSYTFATAGTYYIKVYPYDNLQSAYVLSLAVVNGEANDQPSGAGVLALDTNAMGYVGGQDVADWWTVTLGPSVQAEITLKGLSADIDLQVWTSGVTTGAGSLVGQSWNASTASEVVTVTAPSSGATYYIRVLPYQSAQSTYTLRAVTGASSGVDLRLQTFTVTSSQYTDRVVITVTNLEVVNDGVADSGPFKVLAGLSASNVRGSTLWYQPQGQRWVDSYGLPAGYMDTWSAGSETIYKTGISPSGSYYIVFHADCDRTVAESDELDNYAYSVSASISVP